MKKGPLIRVELSPGRFVKMYEADALARGLIKAQPASSNKMQPPAANKSAPVFTEPPAGDPEPDPEPDLEAEQPPADDLKSIDGIGPATVRKLKARGVVTFAALRTCALAGLPEGAIAAIEAWRLSGE